MFYSGTENVPNDVGFCVDCTTAVDANGNPFAACECEANPDSELCACLEENAATNPDICFSSPLRAHQGARRITAPAPRLMMLD